MEIRPSRPSPFSGLALPESRLKLLLVGFRDGERVDDHPEVRPLLQQGWRVKSVAPRVVEGEGLKLLVVLQRARRPRAFPVPDPAEEGTPQAA